MISIISQATTEDTGVSLVHDYGMHFCHHLLGCLLLVLDACLTLLLHTHSRHTHTQYIHLKTSRLTCPVISRLQTTALLRNVHLCPRPHPRPVAPPPLPQIKLLVHISHTNTHTYTEEYIMTSTTGANTAVVADLMNQCSPSRQSAA